jgi:hypothetical protein
MCLKNDITYQLYRSYRGQVDRVTDVIRCAIVFKSVDELVKFIKVCIRLHVLLRPQSFASFTRALQYA